MDLSRHDSHPNLEIATSSDPGTESIINLAWNFRWHLLDWPSHKRAAQRITCSLANLYAWTNDFYVVHLTPDFVVIMSSLGQTNFMTSLFMVLSRQITWSGNINWQFSFVLFTSFHLAHITTFTAKSAGQNQQNKFVNINENLGVVDSVNLLSPFVDATYQTQLPSSNCTAKDWLSPKDAHLRRLIRRETSFRWWMKPIPYSEHAIGRRLKLFSKIEHTILYSVFQSTILH